MKLTRDDLKAIFAGGWADIDTALSRAESLGLLPELNEQAYWKAELRRAAKRVKDTNGLPVIWNLVEIDADGNERRIYKTREMFPLEDYHRAISDEVRQMNLHHQLASALAQEASERFHVQLDLPIG